MHAYNNGTKQNQFTFAIDMIFRYCWLPSSHEL